MTICDFCRREKVYNNNITNRKINLQTDSKASDINRNFEICNECYHILIDGIQVAIKETQEKCKQNTKS